MPNVFAYFDSSEHAELNQCAMLRLWFRSWAARGWTPRLLTIRNAINHPRFEALRHDPRNLCYMAAECAKVKWVCPVEAINFNFTPANYRKQGVPLYRSYGSVGWEGAGVVHFENCHDAEIVTHCGRPF